MLVERLVIALTWYYFSILVHLRKILSVFVQSFMEQTAFLQISDL